LNLIVNKTGQLLFILMFARFSPKAQISRIMKSLSWTSLILFVLFPIFIFGESRVDSLKNELSNAGDDSTRVHLLILMWESTAYSDPNEARQYALKALEISKKSNYTRGVADAWQRIAAGYSIKTISDSARYYYDKALEAYTSLNDVRMEGVILNNIAMIYYDQGDYIKAIRKTEKSLKKSSEADDTPGIAVALQLLGNIHHFLGNYEEAQKYLIEGQKVIEKIDKGVRYADGLVYLASNYLAQSKYRQALSNLAEAITIYKKEGDNFYLSQALNNTGYIYYDLQKYDSAKLYLGEAVSLAEKYQNNSMFILATNNLGLVNQAEGNFSGATENYLYSLKLARKFNDRQRIALISKNLGDLAQAMKQYRRAIAYYDSAAITARQIGSKNSLNEAYLGYSNAWASLGDYKKSLEYFKQHATMEDSLYNENKTRQMEEMEARYQKEKHEKEIAIQKSEIEILSRDVKLQSIRQNVLIAGLVLTFLMGLYFIIHLRRKMKRTRLIRTQEKLLEEQKLRNAELERDNYLKELEIKKNELTSHALHIVQKNELLQDLKKSIGEMEDGADREDRQGYRKLKFMINGSAQTDKEWENFNRHFEKVHQGFLSQLKTDFPVLTSNDLRLSAMMKLNLSSKEVAAILNISPESVKKARYRLRKKLELPEEADLHTFMMSIGN